MLLFDALDEAEGLAPLIGSEWSRAPEWLRLIVTSRPHETGINAPLQALDPWMLEAGCAENREDIRAYLRRELHAGEETVEKILGKSEGLFLYVSILRAEIEAGRLSISDVDAFPRGLGGIYHAFFHRYFPDLEDRKTWRPVIETVCAARQPLSLEEAAQLFPAFYHPSEIASGLGSLFPAVGGGLRPFHHSRRNWVTDAGQAGVYVVRTAAGHERLASEGWRLHESGLSRPYYIAHLPAHLAASGRVPELEKLLLDPACIEERLRAIGVDALIADYELLPGRREIDLLHGALRLSAHVLLRDENQLASQMLGRLGGLAEMAEFAGGLTVSAKKTSLVPVSHCLDGPGGALICALGTHEGGINSVAIREDGTVAVSGGCDGSVYIWDLVHPGRRRLLSGHTDEVNAVLLSPVAGGLVVSGAGKRLPFKEAIQFKHVIERTDKRPSRDTSIRIWNLNDGSLRNTLVGQTAAVRCLVSSGRLLLSGSDDGTIRMWDLKEGKSLGVLGNEGASVVLLDMIPGRLAAGRGDCTRRTMDVVAVLLTKTQFARHRGCDLRAVTVALQTGRIAAEADGRINPKKPTGSGTRMPTLCGLAPCHVRNSPV